MIFAGIDQLSQSADRKAPWFIFHILLVLRLNGHTNVKYWAVFFPLEAQILLAILPFIITIRKLLRY